jgi:hypothetical protein
MSSPIVLPEALRSISWNEAFAEGERRIKEKMLNALVKTPTRDRSRLMAQREVVQKKIARALEENDSKKLKLAFKAQIVLVKKIAETN